MMVRVVCLQCDVAVSTVRVCVSKLGVLISLCSIGVVASVSTRVLLMSRFRGPFSVG